MTTSSPGRRDSRLIMWLGHYSTHLLAIVLALSVISDATGRPGFMEWPAAIIWLAWVGTLPLSSPYHDSRLCERCLAAAPTLNPEAAIRRWISALWCHHHRSFWFTVAGVLFGWVTYTAVGIQRHHEHPWQYAVDALVLVLLGVLYLVPYQHRRLYPWCPYCRWDDGGDEEAVPDVPDDDHGRIPERTR